MQSGRVVEAVLVAAVDRTKPRLVAVDGHHVGDPAQRKQRRIGTLNAVVLEKEIGRDGRPGLRAGGTQIAQDLELAAGIEIRPARNRQRIAQAEVSLGQVERNQQRRGDQHRVDAPFQGARECQGIGQHRHRQQAQAQRSGLRGHRDPSQQNQRGHQQGQQHRVHAAFQAPMVWLVHARFRTERAQAPTRPPRARHRRSARAYSIPRQRQGPPDTAGGLSPRRDSASIHRAGPTGRDRTVPQGCRIAAPSEACSSTTSR